MEEKEAITILRLKAAIFGELHNEGFELTQYWTEYFNDFIEKSVRTLYAFNSDERRRLKKPDPYCRDNSTGSVEGSRSDGVSRRLLTDRRVNEKVTAGNKGGNPPRNEKKPNGKRKRK